MFLFFDNNWLEFFKLLNDSFLFVKVFELNLFDFNIWPQTSKTAFVIVFLSVFNLVLFYRSRLDIFRISSQSTTFSIRNFVKILCPRFDKSFLHPFDEKYCRHDIFSHVFLQQISVIFGWKRTFDRNKIGPTSTNFFEPYSLEYGKPNIPLKKVRFAHPLFAKWARAKTMLGRVSENFLPRLPKWPKWP